MALAAFALPLLATAQTKVDFEDATSYKAIGVYDACWEESPFRTGKLKGNAAVIDNFLNQENDEGIVPNPSSKIVGVQRSRFGSNMFGLRVDLNEPFEITPTYKYVHVLVHKPVTGKMMLVGLGKRKDRAGQSQDVEQFWVKSTTEVGADAWGEAVFPVKGNTGVEIYSLVVVPDCSSPDKLTEDFVAYIDDIEVNTKSTPSLVTSFYAVNYDKDTKQTRSDRYLNSIRLTSPSAKTQTITVSQKNSQLLYMDFTEKTLAAKAGEILSPSVSWTGTWMNAYTYIDYGQDGSFNCDLNDDGTPATGSDVASYSNCGGKNSAGSTLSNTNTLSMPTFTLPSDLKPGFYRMRYKVDWDDIDAGGSLVQNIAGNGGSIVDTRLNVHADEVSISAGSRNGYITKEDGTTELVDAKTAWGEAVTIKATPAPGFKIDYIVISHGYNLTGDEIDKYGNRQYTNDTIKASKFSDEGLYTIPASMVDGDISIDGQFASDSAPEPEPDYDGYYTLNYDKDTKQTRTSGDNQRYTNTVTFTTPTDGAQAFDTQQSTNSLLFIDQTDKAFKAMAGETVSFSSDFNASWMHSYVYIDFGDDGEFAFTINDDGTPADGSDIFSYSHYSGKNSKGESADEGSALTPPDAAIPAEVATGFYRVRYKIDWDDLDAGGSKVQSTAENGGIIFDTRVNVHASEVSVSTTAQNGTVTDAAGTALDGTKASFGEDLAINFTPASGYHFVSATIKHGYNLSGTRLNKYGTVQYDTEEITADDLTDGVYTLAAEKVDGDIAIECVFSTGTGINALADGSSLTFRGETGKLVLAASQPAHVNVTDTAGRTLFNDTLSGSHAISLPPGVYTVNGLKVVVK